MTSAVFLAALLAWTAAKETPLAIVVRVKGHAEVGTGKAMKPTRSGDVLARHWRIKTQADGRVLLRFLADNALVDIKPSSLVELDLRENQIGSAALDLTVLGGEASFQFPAGSGDRASTATTVTTVKSSSQFGMSTATNGSTRVDVLTGTVQVCNQMTGEHVLVAPGQSQVSGYEGFEELRLVDPDSSLARMDVKAPTVDTIASASIELAVPFADPVTGKASTLLLRVKRNP